MPDTVVEFINSSTLTHGQLTSGVTIVQNAASEQAVVRDITVTNPLDRRLQLSVGNSVLTEFVGSSSVTGTELLGESTSLTLRTLSTPFINTIQKFDSGGIHSVPIATVFSDSPGGFRTGVTSRQNFASSTGLAMGFVAYGANGDFYYSSNRGGPLRRRNGGINAADNTVGEHGTACSFDGRFIYSFRLDQWSSVLVTDTLNRTSAEFMGSSFYVSSTGRSAAINGAVWVRPEWSSNNHYFAVPSLGVYMSSGVGGLATGNSGKWHIGIGRNTSGDYIGIQIFHTQPLVYWWNLGPDLSTASVRGSGAFNVNQTNHFTFPSSDEGTRLQRLPGHDNRLIFFGGTSFSIFNLDNLSNEGHTFFSGYSVPFSNQDSMLPIIDSGRVNADFGAIGVRATGIKTTP